MVWGSDQWHWHSWGLATLSPGEVLWLKSKQLLFFFLLAWRPALLLVLLCGCGGRQRRGLLPAGAAAGILQPGKKPSCSSPHQSSWIWSGLSDQLSDQPRASLQGSVCELWELCVLLPLLQLRNCWFWTQMESGHRDVCGEEVCAKTTNELWESLVLAD